MLDEAPDAPPRQELYHPPAHPPVPLPPGVAPSPTGEPTAPSAPGPEATESREAAAIETHHRSPGEPPFLPPPPRPTPAGPPQAATVAAPVPPEPTEAASPAVAPATVPETPAPEIPRPAVAAIPATSTTISPKLKVIASAGATLLAVAYLLAGVLAAPAESRAQVDALQQTGHDLTKIDAFLSNVSVRDSSKTDNAAFKVANDGYAVKLTETSAILIADQDRLDATTRNIDLLGWLTPLQNGQVHSHDAAISNAIAALADVARAVAIAQTETAFSSAYASAAINADSGAAAAKRKDFAGATSSFQEARNDLSKAELLVKDPDVPPQFAPLVDYYSREMRDLGGLTGAVQANDMVGAIAYLKRLIADSTALTFDQAGYRAWYSKKIGGIQADFRKHAGRVPRYAPTSTQLV